MQLRLLLLSFLCATACDPDDAVETDTGDGTGDSTEVDVEPLYSTCEPLTVDLGNQTAMGDCVREEALAGGTQLRIRADCTDPDITGLLDKRHLVMVPDVVTRDALWLHIGGTGGQPTNSQNIGKAAVEAGYRYISIAYPNEISASERCKCDDGPRAAECEGLARYEILYGDDVTEMFDMEADEAIVPRFIALLASMHDRQPAAGWDAYVVDGAPLWSDIAVSGFSQGGGMAGLIARDHAVDRTLYFSKGAGTVLDAIIDPRLVQPCADASECASGMCCPLNEFDCGDVPTEDGICLEVGPALYARVGADLDGDGHGDGGVEDRATAPNRQFAVIHRDEGAYNNSPATFESWGMGSTFVDVDTTVAPYAASAQLFSTAAPPRNDCSEHQSMGADACQARDGDGNPVMRPAWMHAMTASL